VLRFGPFFQKNSSDHPAIVVCTQKKIRDFWLASLMYLVVHMYGFTELLCSYGDQLYRSRRLLLQAGGKTYYLRLLGFKGHTDVPM
jgi:hypothetical protein